MNAQLSTLLAVGIIASPVLLQSAPPQKAGESEFGKPVPADGQVATPNRVFRVDAAERVKALHPLHGVNAGPGHVAPNVDWDSCAAEYEQMRIREVRMHDIFSSHGGGGRPGDISTIFGNDFSKDTVAPASYDWAETDAVVGEIEAIGADAMFRFGESWPSEADLSSGKALVYVPPEHHATVARICSRIAEHYGGTGSPTIKLWEIWNEPNLRRFWDPPPPAARDSALTPLEEFYGLYAQIAKQLDNDHPGIFVGGPGAAGGTDEEVVGFAEKFLAACRVRKAPLRFYSWHSYNRELEGPYCYARQAQALRRRLEDYGFPHTALVLGEWSSSKAGRRNKEWGMQFANADGAAFTAAALIYLHQHSDVRYAFRYRGDYFGQLGLLQKDRSLKLPAYAFRAYGELFSSPSKFISMLGTSGGNTGGRAAIASIDKGDRQITALVSLWRCNSDSQLHFVNLPASLAKPSIEIIRVSKEDPWETVSPGLVGKTPGSLSIRLAAPEGNSAVFLVKLTPGEGRGQQRPKKDPSLKPDQRDKVKPPRPPGAVRPIKQPKPEIDQKPNRPTKPKAPGNKKPSKRPPPKKNTPPRATPRLR